MHKCNYFLQINIHTYICRSSHLQNLETIDETASLIGDFVGTTTSTTNTITTAVQNLDNSIWQGADSDVSSSEYSLSQHSHSEGNNMLHSGINIQPPPRKPKPLVEDTVTEVVAPSQNTQNKTHKSLSIDISPIDDSNITHVHNNDNDKDEMVGVDRLESYQPNLHKEMMAMAASVHFGENTINVIATSFRLQNIYTDVTYI